MRKKNMKKKKKTRERKKKGNPAYKFYNIKRTKKRQVLVIKIEREREGKGE